MATPSTLSPVIDPTINPATDPATLSGARKDPNYIGATNFAALQKQYTPYQIEQSTTRNGNDIFWKAGSDISKVPTAAPTTNFTAPVEKPPVPASVVGEATPVLTSTNPGNAEFDARNQAAASYLVGLTASIDNIQKQQELRLADQKAAQEKTVNSFKDKLASFMNGTDYQTSLASDRELFNVKQQISDLGMISTKIADASNALNQGLIFEEGRPTRMELLTGRSAELKKQGLAQIQALQSSAEIIKGNIDLARAYADDSISAIKMDNDKKIGALNTLLDLENKSLISISDDEKATIKERMNALSDEANNIAKNKDALFALAKDNPQAFSKGGVTFTDSLEAATAKMMPYLSEQQKADLDKKRLENELLQSSINENNAQAAKAGRSGTGSGSGAGGGLQSEIAADVAALRAQNYNEADIRAAIVQQYGGQLKTTELTSLLDNTLQGAAKAGTPQQAQADRVLAKQQDLEAKGILELETTTGKYSDAPNASAIKNAESAGLISWNGTNWVKDGKDVSDPSKIKFDSGARWYLPKSSEKAKVTIE